MTCEQTDERAKSKSPPKLSNIVIYINFKFTLAVLTSPAKYEFMTQAKQLNLPEGGGFIARKFFWPEN